MYSDGAGGDGDSCDSDRCSGGFGADVYGDGGDCCDGSGGRIV